MKHLVKGSKEARDYMARLRKMRGKGKGSRRRKTKKNPPMLVIGNPGPKMPSRKKLEDHYWNSIHPDYKNVGAKGKARKVLTLNERTQATTITPLHKISMYKLLNAWNESHPSARIPNPNLGDAAVQIAAQGAREYLSRHELTADPKALTETLKSWVKIKLPEALDDAKKALEAGMGAVAEQTFAASMIQAGIEAAKEASIPKKNPSVMADVVSGAAFGAGGLMAERALTNPQITKKAQSFVSKKIGKLVREGYPQDQAVAIAYSMARRKGYKVPAAPNASGIPTIKRKKSRRRGNPTELPAHIANNPKFKAALKEFRRRHGADPVEIREVEVPKGFPKFLVPYGQAPHAVYDAPNHSNKGKRIHHFGKGKRGRRTMPWLVTSPERGSKFLAYVGGTFRAKPDWLYD